MGGSAELKTLKHGLKALAFLNRNGLTNLATLVRHLGMPRANAYRLVVTLVAEGYVIRIPNSCLYIVSPQVRQLSNGLQQDELLTTVAMPIVERLGAEVKWPLALATPLGTNMLVRLATDIKTPLALFKARPGLQTPMVMTTTGVLYLALQEQCIRNDLINAITATGNFGPRFDNLAMLVAAMRFARANRYLLFDGKLPEGSLGVPIMRGNQPIGGLVMRYIKAGVSSEKAVELYLPRLREAADNIAADLAKATDVVVAGAGHHPMLEEEGRARATAM